MQPRALPFAPGGYRFVPGRQFSGGVAAEPGFALRRVRFREPLPLARGLAAARAILDALGRPPEALAASYAARTGVPVTPEMIIEFAVAMALSPIAAAA